MIRAFANPHRFMALSRWLAPACLGVGALLMVWSVWQGLWVVPQDDYQGGDIMRAMFVHVPSAWLAMASYMGLAATSLIWFVWRHELAAGTKTWGGQCMHSMRPLAEPASLR